MVDTSLTSVYRRLTPWAALLILMLLFCPAVAAARAIPAPAKQNTPAVSQAEQRYLAAKDVYYQLEHDPALHHERSRWLAGIRNFRRLYQSNPSGGPAPACLYMMARMYYRMYQIFSVPIDLEESLDAYRALTDNFPHSPLADDALFMMATIELQEKHNPGQAGELYRKILDSYPQGDKAAAAASGMEKLAAEHNITLPEATTPRPAAKKSKPVTILPLQHWSSQDYTRIVVRAAAPVTYQARLLEKNNDQPRRLYIDLEQSYLPPKDRSLVPIQDGLLKQIRTGQINDDTVRVALEIESISNYKIYSLKDPFRLIIDVHGTKKNLPPQEVPPQAPVVHISPAEKKKPPEINPETAPQEKKTPFVVLKDNKKVRPAATPPAVPTVPNAAANLSLAQQLGLGVRRIVIDPGHGGKDPGAMAYGLKEKDITLAVAHRTAEILKEKYHYDVILTREDDNYISLEERTAIANTRNADLFVSIHVNAHPSKQTRGVETFFLNLATNSEAMRVAARENATSTHNINELQDILSDLMKNAKIKESSQLAQCVQTSLISGLGDNGSTSHNLGVKQAPFYVLIGASMPAVLAEISFITNPEEAKLLKTTTYLNAIAEQIARGVATFVDHRRTAALLL